MKIILLITSTTLFIVILKDFFVMRSAFPTKLHTQTVLLIVFTGAILTAKTMISAANLLKIEPFITIILIGVIAINLYNSNISKILHVAFSGSIATLTIFIPDYWVHKISILFFTATLFSLLFSTIRLAFSTKKNPDSQSRHTIWLLSIYTGLTSALAADTINLINGNHGLFIVFITIVYLGGELLWLNITYLKTFSRNREQLSLRKKAADKISTLLRAPLFSIIGIAESMAGSRNLTKNQIKKLSLLLEHGFSLSVIIKRLVDFSPDTPVVSSTQKTSTPLNYTVLSAGDDPVHQMVLAEHLKSAGYGIITISSGSELLNILPAIAKKIDLILLDLILQDINGDEVCRRIRKTYPKKILPILFITNGNSSEQIRKGYECGATACLSKPISKAELLSHIHIHLMNRKKRKFNER